VVETDAFVGAVLDTPDRLDLAANTLVIFSSDNGGLYHWWEAKETDDVKHYRVGGRAAHIREFGHQGNAWMRGTKADIWEGGPPGQLYHLGDDPAETCNLYEDEPEVVARLAKLLDDIRNQPR
jgi:arylsulfatase A-like enzyme